MNKTLVRIFIIISWIGALAIVLYAPTIFPSAKKEKTINIFTWGDILDPKILQEFEKETGISVHLSYYGSNEELIVKMKATKGEGYDLIAPSDYAVAQLIKEELLAPLEKEKLLFWNKFNPKLLGHFFDPENRYSIPFAWEVFLFGVNKEFFSQHPTAPSWRMLFDAKQIQNSYMVSMTNDPVEACLFASFYLFGPKTWLNKAEIQAVENLLIQQKQWVEAYATFRGDYFLATQSCQLAVASSSYLWRTIEFYPHVDFILPEEGSFIGIENFCIPRSSSHQELTYTLLHYLFTKHSIEAHGKTFGFFPPTIEAQASDYMPQSLQKIFHLACEHFADFHFTQQIMPPQKTQEIWVKVKSAPESPSLSTLP